MIRRICTGGYPITFNRRRGRKQRELGTGQRLLVPLLTHYTEGIH